MGYQSNIKEYYRDKIIFLNCFAIINSHYFSCEEFHNMLPINVTSILKVKFHSFKISTETFNYERLLQIIIVIRDTKSRIIQFDFEPQVVQTCMSKYEQSLTLAKIFIAATF